MVLLTNCEGWPGIEPALSALQAGRSALDTVETGTRAVEAEVSVDSVGKGGKPDLLGQVTCDAAIMDGSTLEAGAVGNLAGFLHAISVSRQVMERLPHVMLVAEGAARFAREIGAEPAEMLTEAMRQEHENWLAQHVPADARSHWPDTPLAPFAWKSGQNLLAGGTVCFLAQDQKGNIAAATSTSGWVWRYPGRIGDSPIIGAGLYADNRYGACGCTHIGEMTIRAGTARSVVLYLKQGASVRDACLEAMADLARLRSGFTGPVVIHAIDTQANHRVLSTHELGELSSYQFWTSGETRPVKRQAEVVSLGP